MKSLLYYDGANLNAILGKVKPGDMGFDVLHMNLHKTFTTPHVAAAVPVQGSGRRRRTSPAPPCHYLSLRKLKQTVVIAAPLMGTDDLPLSIGTLSGFAGNTGILLRALSYALLLGKEGMHRVGQFATLNANYMAARLAKAGDFSLRTRRVEQHMSSSSLIKRKARN